jgi:hypothetical protein
MDSIVLPKLPSLTAALPLAPPSNNSTSCFLRQQVDSVRNMSKWFEIGGR